MIVSFVYFGSGKVNRIGKNNEKKMSVVNQKWKSRFQNSSSSNEFFKDIEFTTSKISMAENS